MVFKNTILLNVSHVFGMLSIYKMLFSCEILPVAYRFFHHIARFYTITTLQKHNYHAAVISLPRKGNSVAVGLLHDTCFYLVF